MDPSFKISGIISRLTLLLLQCLFATSLLAQTNVVLQMEQLLAGRPFTFAQTTQAEMGYYFNVTRLQYYVSEITLIHDGGQRTPVVDYHLLIDPSKDSVFILGNFPVTDLEEIEFWIGVDSAHNHLDPAMYPANHPLALHVPTMHWGWAGGYRFIALEGYAGHTPTYIPNNYQIHTIAEENYRKVSLPVDEILDGDTLRIPIRADYAMLLHKIDVSLGLEFHSSIGPSKQISLNTRLVFTPILTGSAYQPKQINRLDISPNPSTGFFTITMPSSTTGPLTLRLISMQGSTILEETILTTTEAIPIESPALPGMYFVSLSKGQQLLATEKVIIH